MRGDFSEYLNSSSNNTNTNSTEEANTKDVVVPLIIDQDYEDSDSNGQISIGDIVNLDPTLTQITVSDISINALLVNVTAESNMTHLTLVGDTSSPWKGFNYSARQSQLPYFVDDDNSYASLDGVDDYVNITNKVTNFNESFTVSFWTNHGSSSKPSNDIFCRKYCSKTNFIFLFIRVIFFMYLIIIVLVIKRCGLLVALRL